MKKTFSVISANKKPARQVDAIKFEIKKYVNREKGRDLPVGSDFWDFECKAGITQELAETIHFKELNSKIDQIVSEGVEEFYVEVIAKARTRQKKNR